MARYLFGLVLSLFCFLGANAIESSVGGIYLGSREGDPASIVENVSTIHGDYTEVEVDVTVASPDSLVLSRFYSSKDTLPTASFGGWRFNPHCFLTVQKDPQGKTYSSAEGKFERTFVYVGNPDGSILTYIGWKNVTNPFKRILFKIDPEAEDIGIANNARGEIGIWTNLKNNELYYDPRNDSFELLLCTEGRRFYVKTSADNFYSISHEILPSGNKIFYEFNKNNQLEIIKETNATQKKVLAWIKIQYGNTIHLETSDGKAVDYEFQLDPSGIQLLTSVTRSNKPDLHYHYQVIDGHALLVKKILPDERYVEVKYYADKSNKYKVRSVTTPSGAGESSTTQFIYDHETTRVEGPGPRRVDYRFNENFQLLAIEQYLSGSLYRTYQKSWGTKSDAGNLISTSVVDANGNVFYHKHFTYDSKGKGNIVEEREYGDVIGLGATPLIVDENGLVTNQDGYIKNYSYFSGKNTHGFFQTDAKGTGVKYWYKKGTNLLLKKFVLTKGSPESEEEGYRSKIKERHFYTYNDDNALIQVIVDDGKEATLDDDEVSERIVTNISPKQELPNIGAPEVLEERYISRDKKATFLLKRTACRFDSEGNIVSQSIYDANENHRYTLTKRYKQGMLVLETDPLGNEIQYTYDANQNLVLQTHSDTGISIEYGYDLRNRLVYTGKKDRTGNRFETQVAYDSLGNKLSEIDRFGNETIYVNDSLGRPTQITYPQNTEDPNSSLKSTYIYTYDLFDNPVSVTDPKGRTLTRSYNVHGEPIQINHLNGTKEVFKYDSGGNLHHYYGTDGLLQVYGYDYKGRLNKLEYFKRGSKGSNNPFKEKTYTYGAFHKISETDESDPEIDDPGPLTSYTYDDSGRLATLNKNNQKVEFIYDSLGRTQGVKKWKSAKTFTLEIKEYDLLDRVIEERTEDQTGKALLKKRYIYNDAGYLEQLIGFPQNKESVLLKYEYDGFGRLCKATNAAGHATTIIYDDHYINEWGQKTQKRSIIDPMGNQTEEVFDVNGHLINLAKKDKSGRILAHSESSYDSLGNKIAERVLVLSAFAPSNIYETGWSLNQLDQIESYTSGKGTPEERRVRFEYDSYGDIVAKYNHGSKTPITYRYSSRGNLDAISYKEGKKEIAYELSYDSHKNITEVHLDSSFTISYSFNADDMPLTETIKDEFGSYQVGCTYDGEGKIQTLQLPDESFIEYIYEGPFIREARRFSKDKKELYCYQVVSRDLMGNILEEILPGHLGGRWQLWDKAGRRVEISTDFFQDRVLEGGYDPLENIKKRETILDDAISTIDYDYSALDQLILEKGESEHKYTYDSIGNRLQRDSSVYKVNSGNQLTEAEGAVYTFDPNGNLATKTIGTRTWIYQSNHLNQIVSIKDPEENTVKFSYDLSGKRLAKRVEIKGKKAQISRFFYLGDTEIGSVDEKGVITELKVPSNPNDPEAPSIAIEIRKETYVPLYDLQGNIVCLLDHQKRKVMETYRYSIYGEEKIIDERGRVVTDSIAGNSWRYRGKRVDKETGLIYFGYRYYDSQIGRWTSPDPAGAIDGPNLYAFSRNNPIKYVDYFGLSSTIDENCGCTQHNHPGWHNAPEGCVCICGKDGNEYAPGSYRSKIGSDIKSAIYGISHGIVDFVVSSIHDLQTAVVYADSGELQANLHERRLMIEAVEQSQNREMASVENYIMRKLAIDASDTIYQSFRSKTTFGLQVGSLVTGGYGVVKGGIGFAKLTRIPLQISTPARNISLISSNPLQGTRYTKKVLLQMESNLMTGKPDFHGFPKIVDNYAGLGQRELIKGKDGLSRIKVSLEGSYRNQDGYFEWIIEANQSVNHRLFFPNR